MQENSKYFSAEKIFSRLSMIFKKKMEEYNLGHIVEMCAWVEFEVLGTYASTYHKNKHAIDVVDYQALLPCDVFRVKDVYTTGNNRILGFTNNGVYLHFSEECTNRPANGSTIYINYDAIPTDDNGYPLFLRGHEDALYWGCVIRMHEEDHADGLVNENVWRDWMIRYEVSLDSADNGFRHHSRNELKEFMAVVHDMIPRVNEMNLNKLG